MSQESKQIVCIRIATPRYREICRNIALLAWLVGIVPSIVAVVALTGTTVVFAVLMSVNAIFLLLNCSFCCLNLHTIKKKKVFYVISLIFITANVPALLVVFTRATDDIFQIIGLVGCGFIAVSCISLVMVITLLSIHGPEDPGPSDSGVVTPELGEGSHSDLVDIRYVLVRTRQPGNQSTFQVEPGQVLSRPHSGDIAIHSDNTSLQSCSTDSQGESIFPFAARGRQRRISAESQIPIRIISDGIVTPSPRVSTITLIRRTSRTSMDSIEYDTGSVRCTCFSLPSDISDDENDVPPYSEIPRGNVSGCPIHGVHPVSPPPYDSTSVTDDPSAVPGLPKYDDVVVLAPAVLSSVSETGHNSPGGTTPKRISAHSIAHSHFETIPEDGSETIAEDGPNMVSGNGTEMNPCSSEILHQGPISIRNINESILPSSPALPHNAPPSSVSAGRRCRRHAVYMRPYELYQHERFVATPEGSGTTSEVVSQVIPEDDSQVIPEDDSQVIPEDDSQVIPENESQVISEDESQVISEDESQVISEDESQVIPEKESQVIHQEDESQVIMEEQFKTNDFVSTGQILPEVFQPTQLSCKLALPETDFTPKR